MTVRSDRSPAYAREKRPEESVSQPPPPGQMPVVMAALSLGVLLMGVQLWLLTVALELYLAGHGSQIWPAALLSGAIFLGGILMLWLLRSRPRQPRVPSDASESTERW
ncbi:MAG TPA: phage holin family protein [Chloroflexota bacterium]|nr:phage holin family protein [Chloroflexota bacterium]